MRFIFAVLLLVFMAVASTPAPAQVVLTGRLNQPRLPNSSDRFPLSAIYAFASPVGSSAQPASFRTWETNPAGWFRLSGPPANYTLLFSNPAHFMRPILVTNLFTRDGETIDFVFSPNADLVVFDESAWDPKPATAYYQPFIAKGKSLTHVGFRLAHDGVDGFGPGAQNVLVSIHRPQTDSPDTWPQVGPTATVLDVDSGGGKNHTWAATFNSGQVPLTPGQTYAVRIKPQSPHGKFQTFWHPTTQPADRCFRVASDSSDFTNHQLWISIASDSDGLLIPYNKRIQKQFTELSRFSRKWSQTHVAQGKSLASVILYAAVSGIQPPLHRQRLLIRTLHVSAPPLLSDPPFRGGPQGRAVGIPKLAIGNGNYTGDASWGVFGAAFAPGEVPLTPGQTYAIEFESIENLETLHDYIDIKGRRSDNKPGFNPYRKHPLDPYDQGSACFNGNEPVDYDLDMQIVEYEHDAPNHPLALHPENLLKNGDFQSSPDAWKTFAIAPDTTHACLPDSIDLNNRIARIAPRAKDYKLIDGGYIQAVTNLDRLDTYRLLGRARANWPLDDKHQCFIGIDPTGQTDNPAAPTILWTTLPPVAGQFIPFTSDPIRPAKQSLSIFLRARSTAQPDFPFKADFANFSLHRVRTSVPTNP